MLENLVLTRRIEMRRNEKAVPAETIDAYLSEVPSEYRSALERLRKIIRSVAPDASESISYRIPVFKYSGMLVGFAAFKDHCSFFVMSRSVAADFKEDLERFDTAEGTVRFSPDNQLPMSIVKRIVKARMKENEARVAKLKKKT